MLYASCGTHCPPQQHSFSCQGLHCLFSGICVRVMHPSHWETTGNEAGEHVLKQHGDAHLPPQHSRCPQRLTLISQCSSCRQQPLQAEHVALPCCSMFEISGRALSASPAWRTIEVGGFEHTGPRSIQMTRKRAAHALAAASRSFASAAGAPSSKPVLMIVPSAPLMVTSWILRSHKIDLI